MIILIIWQYVIEIIAVFLELPDNHMIIWIPKKKIKEINYLLPDDQDDHHNVIKELITWMIT